jgi:hypothetical protein
LEESDEKDGTPRKTGKAAASVGIEAVEASEAVVAEVPMMMSPLLVQLLLTSGGPSTSER